MGHIAFSPVQISESRGAWYGLGPIAVEPEQQGKGFGAGLVTSGLERLQAMGAAGCALIGSPEYYQRFGFINDGAITYGSTPAEVVHWQSFDGQRPDGALTFAPGFGA